MKQRDAIIGLIVLIVLISAVLLVKKSLDNRISLNVPSQEISIQQKIQETFPGLTIPEDGPKANLVDVSGGESFGIATKTEILANLPELSAGKTYKAWLENGEGKRVLLGNLRIAKGGYLIEYNSSSYEGYNKIIITLDNKHVLEGSF